MLGSVYGYEKFHSAGKEALSYLHPMSNKTMESPCSKFIEKQNHEEQEHRPGGVPMPPIRRSVPILVFLFEYHDHRDALEARIARQEIEPALLHFEFLDVFVRRERERQIE